MSSEALLRTFDITTMTKEDAAFEVPFALTVNKNDYVHALVGARGRLQGGLCSLARGAPPARARAAVAAARRASARPTHQPSPP